jgi:hypothetical protein
MDMILIVYCSCDVTPGALYSFIIIIIKVRVNQEELMMGIFSGLMTMK